jgi:hypothetical protein
VLSYFGYHYDKHAKIKPRLKQYLTVRLHSLLSALGGIRAEYLHFAIHFNCLVFIPEAIGSITDWKSDHCRCCILVFTLSWYIPRNALLTQRSRVLPEKLTIPQLAKKFLSFYGTRIPISTLTIASHLSLV